jgi:tripartite tricarboxylate transporter TctB family protein
MTLRADHAAGAAFIGFGLLVFALSGDLPIGSLSLPGSGFMPKILAGFTILFGALLIARAGESRPFAEIEWTDAKHAAAVTAITAAGIAAFELLGFLATMVLLMFLLLVAIERRSLVAATLYSVGVVGLTYVTFEYVLKTPLVTGEVWSHFGF